MGFVQVRNMIAVLHATRATQSYKIYECHVRVKGSQCTYIYTLFVLGVLTHLQGICLVG